MEGVWRSFCCAGCEAAATTIVASGLGDYYRLREQTGLRPEVDPKRFAPYDDPLFQASFVGEIGEGVREAALLLEGVRCSACLWLIEETLKRIDGVRAIEVNYVTRRASVRWDNAIVPLSAILGRLAILGYGAHPYRFEHVDAARRDEQRQWLWRLFVAAFGMMQVMMYAAPAYIAGAGELSIEHEALMRWAAFVLTVPVVFYSAQPFFAGAWRGLRARRAGMDVPVALGVAIAFAASTWASVSGGGAVYFDSLTMFVFLLLFGRYLEVRARNAASGALDYLARMTPTQTERLLDFPRSLNAETVSVARLSAGDVIRVKPGECVAADGCVLEGRSTVNEALLSGESMPVLKAAGAAVSGGSINIESPLLVRVERVGAAATLASIVSLVERAAAQRQPMVETADRYARRFIGLILTVSALGFAVWLFIDPAQAPWIAVSLLVATCPCALSLATPVALTAAVGRLARNGLIVTKGHAIESLARTTDIVFDKTGTLTEGNPTVVAAEIHGDLPRQHCLALACALESGSEHPIAKAIRAYADVEPLRQHADLRLDADSQRSTPGEGMEARIAGTVYRIGNFRYCAELAADAALRFSNERSVSRHSRVWLAKHGLMLASFDLSDPVKEGAVELVAALQKAGKTIHLLSGDAMGPVMEVANRLGIAVLRANASPAEKLDYVAALQREGAVVAMIGDGVNDAPVLAQADVSVAMGSGAIIAQTQAAAVCLSARPAALLRFFELSARTLAIVRQNLVWAFAYNVAVIPLAAAGALSPWQAALGMSISSLFVVLNALRLLRFKAAGP